MNDSDTLFVCSYEVGPDKLFKGNWLVAPSCNGSEWREAQRVQTERKGEICCALSDSRVLIGQYYSTNMEQFRVESGPRIVRVHLLHKLKKYYYFSAMYGSDTLVAMTYQSPDQSYYDYKSVHLHRLPGDRLEKFARIQLKEPCRLVLLADRLSSPILTMKSSRTQS